jgi:hypothetical protein
VPAGSGAFNHTHTRFGGEKEWEAMREIYRNPKSQEQKIRATNALGKASCVSFSSCIPTINLLTETARPRSSAEYSFPCVCVQ